MTLPQAFYARPTLEVARDLIGKALVHRTPAGLTAGLIVEVEAYIGETDLACHAAAGRTTRNAPLYGPPGRTYVYLNYGLHHLVNAVTEADGVPAAVLLRALEPIAGLDLMRTRRTAVRGRDAKTPVPDAHLCRGPGNLAAAMGLDLSHNTRALFAGELTIDEREAAPLEIVWGPRIGITRSTEHPWRAFVNKHPSVSRP